MQGPVLFLLCSLLPLSQGKRVLYTNDSLPAIEARALTGTPTTLGEYPFVVAIYISDVFKQTGMIVHKNWVLTTAVNVEKEVVTNIKVKSGMVDIGIGFKHKISLIVAHPQHATAPDQLAEYNVALLKVSCPPFSTGSICTLPSATDTWIAGTSSKYIGWKTGETVQKVYTSPLIADTDCLISYEGGYLSEQNICMADDVICEGIEGSPLIVDGKCAGVAVPFLTPCGQAALPSKFGDIASYITFITDTLANK